MQKSTKVEKERQGLTWHLSLKDMPHKGGFSYPVFEWSYGYKDGFRGGELRAWPPQGILVFETRRGEGPFRFDNIDEAQAKVDEFGWGVPPHLDKVFQDIQATKSKFPVKGLDETVKIFGQLKEKWEALIS